MPCMAYTHCQPAQPTTVGKRATLWANELVMDLAEIDHRLATLQLRGVKGTTGTQASFMELFKGDADKIRAVDASIAEEMGFDPKAVIPVSGQTYSRKVDAFILNALAGIGQSCMKFPPTCACWPTSRRWKNLLRRTRSVPPPWLISAILCAVSGSLLCPAM